MLPLDLLQIFKPLLWVLPVILLMGIAKSPWLKQREEVGVTINGASHA